jgi:type II secretory pathway pseudopilin PulG
VTTRSTESGFVLVEALAALVITAIAAASLLAALRIAVDRAEEAAVRDLALREARHLLAEGMTDDPAALAAEGMADEGRLTWRRRIAPANGNSNVASVVVDVSWRTRRRMGSTHLETYRLLSR